ncbi:MAG: hypothetical protein E7013_00415 [Alphaproteobacteria bacterium]|nr:hypothetical protein [Alphaproteobacteria bacterium]
MDSIHFPDYKHSILNISSTLLKYYGVETPYASLEKLEKELNKDYKNVILMIFDGLGIDILNKNLPKDSLLQKHIVEEITSVFPPTTTAATTSYYSGKTPIEHAWLGWMCYFNKLNKAIELFKNSDFYTGEKIDIDVMKELPYSTIYEQITEATKNKVKTHKLFPDFIQTDGYKNLEELHRTICQLTKSNDRNFVLCYSPFPDKIIHRYGTQSDETQKSVLKTVRFIENIYKQLDDTLIIVSADHGLIDIEKEFFIEEYPDFMECLSRPLSLEDRTISIKLKDGKKEQVLSAFNRYFAKDFILLSKEEVLQKQLFGPAKPNPKALEFIGDYIIISKSHNSLRQKTASNEPLKAAHAGILKAEMLVPLILLNTHSR